MNTTEHGKTNYFGKKVRDLPVLLGNRCLAYMNALECSHVI